MYGVAACLMDIHYINILVDRRKECMYTEKKNIIHSCKLNCGIDYSMAAVYCLRVAGHITSTITA